MQRMNATRREWIAAGAIFGTVAVGSRVCAAEGSGAEFSHTEDAIHQETVFHASRRRIHEALLDAKQFAAVSALSEAMKSAASGAKPTQISREAGGAFTLFGGRISGRQIELLPDRRIVQAWRVSSWAPGVYSLASFEFVEQGAETRLIFDHKGFPKGEAEHLAEGWNSNYWEPLRKFLARNA